MPINKLDLLDLFALTLVDSARRIEGHDSPDDDGAIAHSYFEPPSDELRNDVVTLRQLHGDDVNLLLSLASHWEAKFAAMPHEILRQLDAFLEEHAADLSDLWRTQRRTQDFVYPVV